MTGLSFELNNSILVELSEFEKEYSFNSKFLDDHNSTSSTLSFNSSNLPNHLTESYNITIIDSIKSGNRIETKNVYKQLINPLFTLLKIKHNYFETSSDQSISNYGSNLSTKIKHLIMFISGDTSINEFFNSLPANHSNIIILPIPQGTGNALSQSLDLSSPILSIKSLLFSGNLHKFQLYQADFLSNQAFITKNGEISKNSIQSLKFSIVGSWCLHSTLVAESDTPELRKFGNDRFKMAAHELLNKNPEFTGSIEIETKVESNNLSNTILKNKQLSYFVLAAVPRFEANFEISPYSKPESTSLYLIYFEHTSSESTMEIMTQAYNKGSHVKNSKVKYLEIKNNQKVKLTIDDNIESRLSKICVDGTIVELIGKNRTVSFKWIDSGNLFCLY